MNGVVYLVATMVGGGFGLMRGFAHRNDVVTIVTLRQICFSYGRLVRMAGVFSYMSLYHFSGVI